MSYLPMQKLPGQNLETRRDISFTLTNLYPVRHQKSRHHSLLPRLPILPVLSQPNGSSWTHSSRAVSP